MLITIDSLTACVWFPFHSASQSPGPVPAIQYHLHLLWYCTGCYQPIPAAAHIWKWNCQRIQWPGDGRNGPSYFRRSRGSIQEDGQVGCMASTLTSQEHIRMGGLSKSMWLHKIWNWLEFTTSTKNSNMYCAAALKHKPWLPSMWPGVLFLVWFNNFDQTTGFYWSCMLLLKPLVLDWCIDAFHGVWLSMLTIHFWRATGGEQLRRQRSILRYLSVLESVTVRTALGSSWKWSPLL